MAGLVLRRSLAALDRCAGRVLEIGCGAGRYCRALHRARPDLEIHGSDLSAASIPSAASKAGRVHYTRADASRLPYRDDSFDAVVVFDLLEHLPAVAPALTEAHRVLRPGGVLHCHVPCERNRFTLHAGSPYIRALKRKHLGHIQTLTTGELVRITRDAGFGIHRLRYAYHFLGQLYDVAVLVALEKMPGVALSVGSIKEETAAAPRPAVSKLLIPLASAANRFGNAVSSYESRILGRWPFGIGVHLTGEKIPGNR